MTPLKEMFSKTWIRLLAEAISSQHKDFHVPRFIGDCCAGLEQMELNQRMRHISTVLYRYLPSEFDAAVHILRKVVPGLPRGYTTLVFPDFVSQYGLDHFTSGMEALAYFTRFGSSEFAVRYFLKRDFDRTLKVMTGWARNDDHHVRRLASEGSRPALPWSFKLQQLIADPSLTRPILEQLKSDKELYVRKSVANHLNDISKFAPDYMLEVVRDWDSSDPHTTWIIRHASRTLIKKGHAGSLSALKFERSPKIKVSPLRLSSAEVRIGKNLDFEFRITSLKKRAQRLVIDYRIHYVKKNGVSVKVFKLKEVDLGPAETITLRKMQRFTDFSTRRHLPGKHVLEIQVNGAFVARKSFLLKG